MTTDQLSALNELKTAYESAALKAAEATTFKAKVEAEYSSSSSIMVNLVKYDWDAVEAFITENQSVHDAAAATALTAYEAALASYVENE